MRITNLSSVLFLALLLLPTQLAQGQHMFELDSEYVGACNQGGCTQLSYSQTAKASWVRIFLPWYQVEPNAPVPPAYPTVWGQMSGQHTYYFSAYIDGIISDAQSLGLNVIK